MAEADDDDPDAAAALNLKYDDTLMQAAFSEARTALEAGEVPIGCVLVKDNIVVAAAGNDVNRTKNPTAHAEIVCVNKIFEQRTPVEEVSGARNNLVLSHFN